MFKGLRHVQRAEHKCEIICRSLDNPLKNEKMLKNLVKDLFPNVVEFFQCALKSKSLQGVMFLDEQGLLNIHEARLASGQSALHFLAQLEPVLKPNYHGELEDGVKPLVDYFLMTSEENHRDALGYTYLHAACMAGDADKVRRLIDRGADVNLDTYKHSPLHIAARHRRADVVKLLLEHGADPNRLDHERSTALHALARLRVCDCLELCTDNNNVADGSSSNEQRPVPAIVDALLAKGANIEARNHEGYTPLELAASLFDLELARSLFKHGASPLGLGEHTFNMKYERIHLREYPITLHIAEMIRLLKSNGYRMDFNARLKILKLWMGVRGSDVDDMMPGIANCDDVYQPELLSHVMIYSKSMIFKEKGLRDWLREQFSSFEVYTHQNRPNKRYYLELRDLLTKEFVKLLNIWINKDTSLCQICHLNYDQAYSILKQIDNWRLPPLNGLKLLRLPVKRQVANILMRAELETIAADIVVADFCDSKLNYYVGLKIAKCLSYEDLLCLFEHTIENSKEKHSYAAYAPKDEFIYKYFIEDSS